ncbi:MAG: 1-(5-phosphoribosyl)-5-[(5-phosphoribosylamino)methylideneamino]imidazole-4-carboxamide isomerase [Chloroflexi bacterium]|nr:1-(5-phosphoribosyl)-5-[(5-phosphoribosylamino)methylideneamino]imidazole-4-carboxamide isomerase [Chloroflexota bacterium]
MIILPAIDIKDGYCVRLYQGDYTKATIYGSDPAQVAQRWQEAGASWLHIVDLNGAVSGYPVSIAEIQRIRASTSIHMEVGGGMRSLAHIKRVLGLGVDRVILGTVALTDRALLEQALARWGERIVVGLDARSGWVATAGWRETSRVLATTLAIELSTLGVQRFIYTDIARDGTLSGPNLVALTEMLSATSRPLIASGGVSSVADLRSLSTLGVEGAIVGKALYTGAIDLGAVIQELEG